MELQSRLVFIDTSAYEQKKFQFGFYELNKLEVMVTEKKIHLLITDVVRAEVESHMKKHAQNAVKALKKFHKEGSFLRAAEEATGGGLFENIEADAVLNEVGGRFRSLIDNGFIEEISVAMVNPRQIFDSYFSSAPPFHREAKKSEFPDAFSLAAVDAFARERCSKVYIVSGDGDMKDVAAINDNFIHLESIDKLLDLVNRNDEKLAQLSVLADNFLSELTDSVVASAQEALKHAEYTACSDEGRDPEIEGVTVQNVAICDIKLTDVNENGASYEVTFSVFLQADYIFTNFSRANWDREDGVYYGIDESFVTCFHREHYEATLQISFPDAINDNAKIVQLIFDDDSFELDLDSAEYR